MMPTASLSTLYADRSRFPSAETVRRRALRRLYERRDVLEQLILSLERYQQAQREQRAECLDFSAGRKC